MSATLLGITVLIYAGVAVSEWMAGRSGMCLVFLAYALANVGLMWETMK